MKSYQNQSKSLVFAPAVLLTVLLAPQGWSQDVRGTIQGRVTDGSGALVPGAAVRVTHAATNQSRDTVSNSSGNFSLPLLPSGAYRITAEKQGFKRFSRDGVELRINDNVEVNISLEIGGLTETVTVTTETPLLETTSASVGQVIDTRRIAELPVPFGTAYFLMRLSPGVNNGGGDQARQQPWEPGATVDYNLAGSGSKTSSITLDGANNTSRDTGGSTLVPGFVPPTDAVAEFKVQTVTFDGAAGGTSGGTMNVSLKSGTNKLHATGYYSGVPQAWTANSFFNNKAGQPKSPSQVKRWGGSVNGPVHLPKLYNGRNKTFFMYAYEGIDYASPQPSTGQIATAAQRTGDFSGLLALGSQYQIYDPFSRRAIAGGRFQSDPIPGNIILPSRISPIAAKLITTKDYPLPNKTPDTADGSGNYYTNASQTVNFTSHTFRADHNFNQNTRMFLRLNKSDADFQLPQWMGADSLYTGDLFGYKMSGFGFDLVHSFTPTLLMNVRVSDARYIRISDSSPAGRGIDLTQKYGFPAYYNSLFNPGFRRPPTVSISEYGGTGGGSATLAGTFDSLLWYPQENRAAAIAFDKSAGIHAFKFGFEYRQERQGRYSYGGAAEGGTFSFDTTYTRGPLDNATAAPRGQGFAAFLLDVPSGGSFQYADSYYEMSTYYGMYFQDDVKVTHKLTLNLSLRYELEGPLTERYNRSVRNFDPTLTHSGNFDALSAAAYAQNPIAERAASTFSTLGGPVFAGVGGAPRELFQRDTNNFMPRIGFAYSLDARTVFRGGYGVYFGPLGMDRGDVNQLNYNRTTNLISTNDNGLHFVASMANPYPTGVLPPIGNGQGADTFLGQGLGTLFTVQPKASRVQKWQFSVQRQLPLSFVLEAGYIGSHGDNYATTRDLRFFPSQYLSRLPARDQTLINYWTGNIANPFAGQLPGTTYNNATITRDALVRNFPQYSSLGMETYEGSNMYHALNVQLQRRFSRGFTAQFGYTHSKLMEKTGFLHPDDLLPQKVISGSDFPNHIATSVIYELPFGKGKMLLANNRAANYIAGGWQLSGIWTFQSGSPLGFGDPIFTGDLKSVLDVDPNQRDVSRWFNTDGPGFNKVAAQQLSMHYQVISPRFSWFRNPRQDFIDMSLLKNTKISEKYNMQFRADAMNTLNHVWLNSPNTTPSSTSFGQITSEKSRSRYIQYMVKFIF